MLNVAHTQTFILRMVLTPYYYVSKYLNSILVIIIFHSNPQVSLASCCQSFLWHILQHNFSMWVPLGLRPPENTSFIMRFFVGRKTQSKCIFRSFHILFINIIHETLVHKTKRTNTDVQWLNENKQLISCSFSISLYIIDDNLLLVDSFLFTTYLV
jgi:hypothetical protein